MPSELITRGFAAVALHSPKNDVNVGGAIRAAGVFGARLVVIGAPRGTMKGRIARTDPQNTHKRLPVQWLEDVTAGIPHGCKAVAVEMDQRAWSLPDFAHPERAYYIFGAEDRGLPHAIRDVCDHIVQIPAGSLNLAAAVNVVLYDRAVKNGR